MVNLDDSSGHLSNLKVLSLLSDQTRLRLLAVLRDHELSVAELQEILNTGQSRISTHLSQLRTGGLVDSRREGQKIFYRWAKGLSPQAELLLDVALQAAREVRDAANDQAALAIVLAKRKEKALAYFNTIAGRLGKGYCPGRSWEAVGHFLLRLVPALDIADLGAGEGLLSQLLAPRAKRVIAIDNSPRMVKVGSELAAKSGLENLEYRLGDLEQPPIEDSSVDLAVLSQALHHAIQPERAVSQCQRILRPGGQLLILDLNQHDFEEARELYADNWLGFSELDLRAMIAAAGFIDCTVSVVSREAEAPFFETLLACATKPK